MYAERIGNKKKGDKAKTLPKTQNSMHHLFLPIVKNHWAKQI